MTSDSLILKLKFVSKPGTFQQFNAVFVLLVKFILDLPSGIQFSNIAVITLNIIFFIK